MPVPIVQGGMGVGVSLSGLASAVANEGGLGVLSSVGVGMFEQDFFSNYIEANLRGLRHEISVARAATKGVLGINIMVALSDYARYVQVAVEEGIDVIFSGAGMPLGLPGLLPAGAETKLAPIVSSGRAARLICQRWLRQYDYVPDAIVVEGPLAGGHLGFKLEQIADSDYSLEKLVPETVAAVAPFGEAHGQSIPVIAAGGIFDGADILKFRNLGAAGVQMATRFVGTHECDASPEFKEAYMACKEEDLVIIKSPVGLPGRAIRNSFLEAVEQGKKQPVKCPCRCIVTCDGENSPYCIALALMNAKRGKLNHGFAFAGANAHRVQEIVSVKELMQGLVREYEAAAAAQELVST